MSITRDFKLSLVAGRSVPLVINANQYDDGEIWRFTLLDENGQKYSPSTGSIIGLKSDGHIIANAGTVSSTGLVIIAETEQMTAAVGKNIFELLIDDDTHGTANFIVFVEPRPGAGGTPSDSDLAVFQEAIDAATTIGDVVDLVDDVAVLEARMDEFTTLTDGSTTGDAELADIRVGADGTTYPNAGDAVRGQYSDLRNALGVKAPFGAIGFNVWDEQWIFVTNHIESANYIPVLPNTDYYFQAPSNPGNGLIFYDANLTRISARYNGGLFTTPENCRYIMFKMFSAYGTTYNHDICLNISQPDTTIEPHNGQYVAYGDLTINERLLALKGEVTINYAEQGASIKRLSDIVGYVETDACTIANGTVPNPGNAYCVYTSNYIEVSKGQTVVLEVNRALSANSNHYAFGYITYNSEKETVKTVDINATKLNENIVEINDDNVKYIRFSIGEYTSENAQVTLRKTDFSEGDVVANIFVSPYPKFITQEYIEERLGGELNDAYTRNLDKLPTLVAMTRCNKTSNGSKDFGFIIITDSHNDHIAEKNSVIMANGFSPIDMLIHCGDFLGNDARDFNASAYQILVDCEKTFFFVIGNHDVGNTKVIANAFTNQQVYDKFIAPIVAKGILESGEYESGKSYYYHDFSDYNIRLICVNEYDDPNDVDPSDNTKYRIRRGDSVISEAQARWFCGTLSSTPSEYAVIVAMHNPFSGNADTLQNDKFTQSYLTNGFGSQRLFSTDFWADAIDAFVNRRSYTCEMVCTGDAEYLNTNGVYYTFTHDFSASQGVFLFYIGGHVHRDLIWQHRVYTYQKQVTPVCAVTSYANSNASDIRRTNDDSLAKDSLTAIGCDLGNKQIRLCKLGVNLTEKMEYRDMELMSVSQT